ncbi:unnamed protein product [Cylindrotheca closterium]|uniref:Threonine/serine exporter-like N-terminal domain-containing protein n=1 Tax=Cylindrotheca closterium TaxID=2856 RepID=A0AAD2G0E6_9STRA|nr:unnamed protein product [Cylindrotheca closterium]
MTVEHPEPQQSDDDEYGTFAVTSVAISKDGSMNGTNDDDDDMSIHGDSVRSDASSSFGRYNWRLFLPETKNFTNLCRWFVVGGASKAKLPDEDVLANLKSLAQCIKILREYTEIFGIPEEGGPKDQQFVLREVFRDLYLGGAPVWALESVMQKAAEGLTGDPNVNWFLMPRRAYMSGVSLGGTHMFKCERGFAMQRMDRMEKVATRLASFASNTKGFNNVPARLPRSNELLRAQQRASMSDLVPPERANKKKLARQVLGLASKAEGLFFFINKERDINAETRRNEDDFWIVSEKEKEVFSRLACLEAMAKIDILDKKPMDNYKNWIVAVCRIFASAGAAGFWFGGSWHDMWIAGFLAFVVASIGVLPVLTNSERILIETVASFLVGLTAGLVSLQWPNDTCYTAIALAGVLDILQGFRVVYAVIEIMSRNAVCGGANLLEGMLFTGLIAYFLQFGQYVANSIMEVEASTTFSTCTNGINEYWFLLLVPLAAVSWSILFTPKYKSLGGMIFHGLLGFGFNFGLTKAGVQGDVNSFASAAIVTFSAGMISRFTGRQAVGNSVAGLYVLLPGAYLVQSMSIGSGSVDGSFFVDIIKKSIVIGMGSWSGTILCSPALLGTTVGILHQQVSSPLNTLTRGASIAMKRKGKKPRHTRVRSEMSDVNNTLLYF